MSNNISSVVDNYINSIIDAEDFHTIETPLKSDKQIKDELRLKLKENYSAEALKTKIKEAISLIVDDLDRQGLKDQKEKIIEELEKAPAHYLKVKEKLKKEKVDDKAKVWSYFYGISDETVLLFYSIALKNICDSNYKPAISLLNLILYFAPDISAYWNALGFCYQKLDLKEEALVYYQFAKIINVEDVQTYFYLAKIYEDLGEKEKVIQEVVDLQELLNKNAELKEKWQPQLEALKKVLKNEKSLKEN